MISIKTKLSDVFNILVIKGANFIITAAVFYITTKVVNSRTFVNFGFWWSIAVMIGGVLLGGTSSSLIRVVVNTKSLRSIYIPSSKFESRRSIVLSLIIAFSLLLVCLIKYSNIQLLLLIFLFGILFQIQASVGSLLRVLEETAVNIKMSIINIITIPSVYYIISKKCDNDLFYIILSLICAYGVGLCISILFCRNKMKLLLRPTTLTYPIQTFIEGVMAFSAVNLFSYVLVNVDFGILKLFDQKIPFEEFGNIKIYFERFVLPIWLILAGALSIGILRESGASKTTDKLRYNFQFGWKSVFMFLLAVAASTGCFYLYLFFFQHSKNSPNLILVLIASLGYSMYAANAVLLDIFVLRNTVTTILKCLIVFFAVYTPCQLMIMSSFGAKGWATGWLMVNLIVFCLLTRGSVEISFQTGSNRRLT